ncbi:hypothetical protein Tco_1542363, partial [Tanacetum coccineum]
MSTNTPSQLERKEGERSNWIGNPQTKQKGVIGEDIGILITRMYMKNSNMAS